MDGSLPVGQVPSEKKLPRKNIIIAVILLLILTSGVAVFFLTQNKTKEPTVSLTKEYNNPFDTKTQYTNPFSNYKNPFDNLTQ